MPAAAPVLIAFFAAGALAARADDEKLARDEKRPPLAGLPVSVKAVSVKDLHDMPLDGGAFTLPSRAAGELTLGPMRTAPGGQDSESAAAAWAVSVWLQAPAPVPGLALLAAAASGAAKAPGKAGARAGGSA